MISYYIEAKKENDNKWEQFTGTLRRKKPMKLEFFQKHVSKYFNNMNYSFRLKTDCKSLNRSYLRNTLDKLYINTIHLDVTAGVV